jgi:hypothetical protein
MKFMLVIAMAINCPFGYAQNATPLRDLFKLTLPVDGIHF